MKLRALLIAAVVLLIFGESAFAQGKIGLAIPYSVEQIDPLITEEPLNQILVRNLGRGLLARGVGELTPEVADRVSVSSDGLVWILNIRSTAEYSDRTRVTPGSVREGFDLFVARAQGLGDQKQARARLSEEYAPGASLSISKVDTGLVQSLSNIASIAELVPQSGYYSAPKNWSMRITLKSPDANFARLLAVLPVVNPEASRSFGVLIGTGTLFSAVAPYQIRENVPGSSILLERSAYFYRPGLVGAQVIEFRVFEDAESALSALRVGAVDIIPLPTARQLAEIEKDPTLVAIDSPLLNDESVGDNWKLRKEHWSNLNDAEDRLSTKQIIVRKSLKLGSDTRRTFDLSETFLP